MTAWGFQDCQRDPKAPGYGSTLGRLFLRTLPNNFAHNSVYTWFPLLTPQTIRPVLHERHDTHLYSFQRQVMNVPVLTVGDYTSVSEILGDPERWSAPQYARVSGIIKGPGFVLFMCHTLCAINMCLLDFSSHPMMQAEVNVSSAPSSGL